MPPPSIAAGELAVDRCCCCESIHCVKPPSPLHPSGTRAPRSRAGSTHLVAVPFPCSSIQTTHLRPPPTPGRPELVRHHELAPISSQCFSRDGKTTPPSVIGVIKSTTGCYDTADRWVFSSVTGTPRTLKCFLFESCVTGTHGAHFLLVVTSILTSQRTPRARPSSP
jgi:hypothetical protein